DVSPIAGDVPGLLDRAACLLELAQLIEGDSLESEAVGVWGSHADAGPNGGVAVRQLDRALADRDALTVLADDEEGVGGGCDADVETGFAGLLGERERPPDEGGVLLKLASAYPPDAPVDEGHHDPRGDVSGSGGDLLRFVEK